jgi:hypothetical protein
MSDLCGTAAGMVTPKGSISTEGQTLQVSILPVLDMSFLLCLSWLLHSRVQKFRRDLWITRYIISYIATFPYCPRNSSIHSQSAPDGTLCSRVLNFRDKRDVKWQVLELDGRRTVFDSFPFPPHPDRLLCPTSSSLMGKVGEEVKRPGSDDAHSASVKGQWACSNFWTSLHGLCE